MEKLITPSLLSGIEFLRDCPPSWKGNAFQSLKATLSRKYKEPTRQIKRGIDFENSIYKTLSTMDSVDFKNYSSEYQQFLNDCCGGVFQKTTKKIIEIKGTKYLLYGKIDVWFPGLIIDIKTTENFTGDDKYLKTSQHEIYCFCEGIPTFLYKVAVFENEGNKIKEVRNIFYFCADFSALEIKIKERIKQDLLYLQAFPDLFDFYENVYCQGKK